MKKILAYLLICISLTGLAFGQEALKSTEEEYYDFLALSGLVTPPVLGYRTLSDSVWELPEDTEHVWQDNNLGSTRTLWEDEAPKENLFFNGIFQGVRYKIFSPEWYNSYNSAAPYGQNDGALWQGKGYNTALTTGFTAEAYGLSLTFKPQLSWTQNKEFEYSSPIYSGANYENKAALYGDYSYGSIDAPQRFGDKSFFNFSFGDTEIRYSWHTLTIGFGTQNIWIGPAQMNPIMHSNNADGYPHFDFGIRNQNISIKDFDLGSIEFRYWLGKTTESEWFDNNDSNDNNLLAGVCITYELPFLDGLRLGFVRTMLSKWENKSPYTMFHLLIPAMQTTAGYDESDQRASVYAEYFIPKGGIDLYLEWARNDYNAGLDNLLRYPFHTQAITAGFRKSMYFKNSENLAGEMLCEITFIESSMDYHFFYDWGGGGNDFYTHHIVTQGYTNKGQYLGAGIGAGGNSQLLSYKLYYPKGYTKFFFYRFNPDLNYSYFIAPRNSDSSTPNEDVKSSIRVIVNIGISSLYYVTKDCSIIGSFIFSDDHNPLNTNKNLINKNENNVGTYNSEHRYNFVTQLSVKYLF